MARTKRECNRHISQCKGLTLYHLQGLKNSADYDGVKLGEWTYEKTGPRLQFFPVQVWVQVQVRQISDHLYTSVGLVLPKALWCCVVVWCCGLLEHTSPMAVSVLPS